MRPLSVVGTTTGRHQARGYGTTRSHAPRRTVAQGNKSQTTTSGTLLSPMNMTDMNKTNMSWIAKNCDRTMKTGRRDYDQVQRTEMRTAPTCNNLNKMTGNPGVQPRLSPARCTTLPRRSSDRHLPRQLRQGLLWTRKPSGMTTLQPMDGPANSTMTTITPSPHHRPALPYDRTSDPGDP